MGSYLADTNLLLRLADSSSDQHAIATQALARLLSEGNEVYLTRGKERFAVFIGVAVLTNNLMKLAEILLRCENKKKPRSRAAWTLLR
jgi:hypothetical protein